MRLMYSIGKLHLTDVDRMTWQVGVWWRAIAIYKYVQVPVIFSQIATTGFI